MRKFICVLSVFFALFSEAIAQNPSLPKLEPITQDNLAQLQELKSWTSTQEALLSRDGHTLVVAFQDGTIQFINSKTLVTSQTLEGNGIGFGNLLLNNDNSRVVYIANGGTIYFWNIEKTAPTAIYDAPSELSISPNLDLFALFDGQDIVVKTLESGDTIATLPTGNREGLIKFSQDGSLFLIVQNQNVIVYSTDNWKPVFSFQTIVAEPTDATFTLNNNYLAVIGHKLSSDSSAYVTTVELWEIGSQKKQATLEAEGIQYTTGFDITGNFMVTSGVNSHLVDVLRVWDLKAQKEIWNSIGYVTGGGTIAFDTEQNIVALGGGTSPIIGLADIQTGNTLQDITTDGGTQRLQFSSDNLTLLTVSYSYVARLWGIPAL